MERQFPKNVRQIGNVSDEPKIYMEDYVDTYLNQLRMKAIDSPMSSSAHRGDCGAGRTGSCIHIRSAAD